MTDQAWSDYIKPRYCQFCAWQALTPGTRLYCQDVIRTVPDIRDIRSRPFPPGEYNLKCVRMLGHDGAHVACANGDHKMAAWRDVDVNYGNGSLPFKQQEIVSLGELHQ